MKRFELIFLKLLLLFSTLAIFKNGYIFGKINVFLRYFLKSLWKICVHWNSDKFWLAVFDGFTHFIDDGPKHISGTSRLSLNFIYRWFNLYQIKFCNSHIVLVQFWVQSITVINISLSFGFTRIFIQNFLTFFKSFLMWIFYWSIVFSKFSLKSKFLKTNINIQ